MSVSVPCRESEFRAKRAFCASDGFTERRIHSGAYLSPLRYLCLCNLISSRLCGLWALILCAPWVDSFLNASMILGGMGPVDDLPNKAAKVFAGCYALYCGVAFISSIAIFMTPILHRFLHKFHLNTEDMKGL